MPLPAAIVLTPATRPVGGLLSAARPIGGEWWRGVTFKTPSCLQPQTVGFCIGDNGNGGPVKVWERPGDVATFQSFGVLQAVECSTLGRPDVRGLAEQSLDVTREWAVARELLTGLASGNPSLADATVIGVAAPANALGCLEQQAAEALAGRMVFIHASPSIATAWLSRNAIWRDGRLWRTALGSVVVVSAGYDGRAPGGAAPVAGDTLFAYATGEVYADVGERRTTDTVNRPLNTAEAMTEEAAIAVFDPCLALAIDTTVTVCAETS